MAWNCVCERTPCDGLDCGVFLPGQAPRKVVKTLPPAEISAIRARAWKTRREMYGEKGHQ